jgi:sigma-B regulation protein RsbU (phosphoserine phosphatase)
MQIVFGPGVLIPGLAIAAFRLHSFRQAFSARMVGQHFVSMRREFNRARSIHESMFPSPYDDGHVRFEYTYRPMRELGGDFVHLHVGVQGLVHLTLIDVTGHGLAAALTVNRLYGELERIRAESPQAEPGDVLTLLNRYIHLTLARHNIYATGACVTLDPYLGELRWANAGHPSGLLRGANGVIRSLDSTTAMLGAVEDGVFDAAPERLELAPSDTLVLFTDGVFEARNRKGQQFGLERVRDLIRVQPPPRHWPGFIATAVDRYNAGRTEDDVLIAALTLVSPRGQPERTDDAVLSASPT